MIEINVAVGDRVELDDPILLLESDKATLDIPAPVAGLVADITVSVGDKVNIGSPVMVIEAETAGAPEPTATIHQWLGCLSLLLFFRGVKNVGRPQNLWVRWEVFEALRTPNHDEAIG